MPIGTVVYERRDDGEHVQVADLTEDGERVMLAKGGLGGQGNAPFATSTNRAPRRFQPGLPGEEKDLRLHLKLLADVGLVGFPNAGKSTMISRISAARPKIADYPFTTLAPNLGVVGLSGDRSFVVADVPGLIEGAHDGHGLGHRFLSHLERTKVLVHLVDVSSPSGRDPVSDFDVITRELELFPGRDASGERLADKPMLVAANKIDALDDPERLARLEAHLGRLGVPLFAVSAATGEGMDVLARSGVARGRGVARARRGGSADRHRGGMTLAARIGILGGTLDPIHVGHLETALAARQALALDRVIVLPSRVPPHRQHQPVASRYHRFAMAALAVDGVDGLSVSDIELRAPEPSYTADTLERFRESSGLPASQIFFITGADAFAEIETWHRYPEVLDLSHFVVVSRPGCPVEALREQLPALAPRMAPADPGTDGGRVSRDFPRRCRDVRRVVDRHPPPAAGRRAAHGARSRRGRAPHPPARSLH